MKIEIKHRYTDTVLLCGEYESVKDCLEKNVGANLGRANLGRAKRYVNSHAFFTEVVRRQNESIFTSAEWAAIAIISIHKICWDAIKKRFGETAMSVFKKLSVAGFDEWEKKYSEILEGK